VTWDEGLAAWWLEEVSSDPAYRTEVMPLTMAMADPQPGERWLDLGCGEGRVMRAIAACGARAFGCDASPALAAEAGPGTVVAAMPELACFADATVDGAVAVLVLEHLDDHGAFFAGVGRVVRPGGVLALVANHPVFTAPGSAPVVDPDDGEVLWRWGRYLEAGVQHERAGRQTLAFHHRPLGDLVASAAAAGWTLERLREDPVGPERAAEDPIMWGQRGIPRLLGVRWRRTRSGEAAPDRGGPIHSR